MSFPAMAAIEYLRCLIVVLVFYVIKRLFHGDSVWRRIDSNSIVIILKILHPELTAYAMAAITDVVR